MFGDFINEFTCWLNRNIDAIENRMELVICNIIEQKTQNIFRRKNLAVRILGSCLTGKKFKIRWHSVILVANPFEQYS